MNAFDFALFSPAAEAAGDDSQVLACGEANVSGPRLALRRRGAGLEADDFDLLCQFEELGLIGRDDFTTKNAGICREILDLFARLLALEQGEGDDIAMHAVTPGEAEEEALEIIAELREEQRQLGRENDEDLLGLIRAGLRAALEKSTSRRFLPSAQGRFEVEGEWPFRSSNLRLNVHEQALHHVLLASTSKGLERTEQIAKRRGSGGKDSNQRQASAWSPGRSLGRRGGKVAPPNRGRLRLAVATRICGAATYLPTELSRRRRRPASAPTDSRQLGAKGERVGWTLTKSDRLTQRIPTARQTSPALSQDGSERFRVLVLRILQSWSRPTISPANGSAGVLTKSKRLTQKLPTRGAVKPGVGTSLRAQTGSIAFPTNGRNDVNAHLPGAACDRQLHFAARFRAKKKRLGKLSRSAVKSVIDAGAERGRRDAGRNSVSIMALGMTEPARYLNRPSTLQTFFHIFK